MALTLALALRFALGAARAAVVLLEAAVRLAGLAAFRLAVLLGFLALADDFLAGIYWSPARLVVDFREAGLYRRLRGRTAQ